MSSDKDQLRLYPVWSNFIYFVAGLYAICVSYSSKDESKLKTALFFVFGVLLTFTGGFSVSYHMNTPSWEDNPETIQNHNFKESLAIDKGFSITLIVYGLLFFFYRLFVTFFAHNGALWKYQLFHDPNWWFSLLFIILSVVFYFLAEYSFNQATGQCVKKTNEEKMMNCFTDHIDVYDIFHSNWHIFTSLVGLFWITMLKNSYNYK